MIPTVRVISIGAIASHPLWNEPPAVRTGHATTTLVQADDLRMVIDPGLPSAVLAAKLSERSPLQPRDVTHVFLTSATPDHMRGLAAFPHARWLAFETEIAAAHAAAHEALLLAQDHPEDGGVGPLTQRLELLQRLAAADDTIAGGVDLFPAAGVTPGCCGILVAEPRRTIVIAGDAVATSEHIADAKVLPTCWDRAQAQESFAECVQIADAIVPGRDNIQYL